MKQLTDKQWTRISADYAAMYVALRRIAAYTSPDRLRRSSRKEYGLDADEAIEYAYENVITEAKNGLRRVKKPFVENTLGKRTQAEQREDAEAQDERIHNG